MRIVHQIPQPDSRDGVPAMLDGAHVGLVFIDVVHGDHGWHSGAQNRVTYCNAEGKAPAVSGGDSRGFRLRNGDVTKPSCHEASRLQFLSMLLGRERMPAERHFSSCCEFPAIFFRYCSNAFTNRATIPTWDQIATVARQHNK
jgi:hypothetical protein